MKQLFAIAFLSVLLASGCAVNQRSAGESVDDTILQARVKNALIGHGSANINLEVHRGTVQLGGFLHSQSAKRDALSRAERVEGASRIIDRLHVVAPDRTPGQFIDDDVMTAAVKTALIDDEVVNGLSVNVEVNRGVVLLTGFVDSNRERVRAVDVAGDVDRVRRVINGIDLR